MALLRSTRNLAIVAAAALSSLLPVSGSLYAQSWYNSAWQYREPVTISHGQVSASLTNFPVLYSVTDTNLKASAQSNGNDIVSFRQACLRQPESGFLLSQEASDRGSADLKAASDLRFTDALPV